MINQNLLDAIEYYKNNEYCFICDIRRKFKITKAYFIKVISQQNLSVRDFSRAIFLNDDYFKIYLNLDKIIKSYSEHRCWRRISEEYNVPVSGIKCIIKKYTTLTDNELCKSKTSKSILSKLEANTIINDYNHEKSIEEIKRDTGVSIHYIKKMLLENGVVLRNKNEANTIKNKKEEHQRKCLHCSYKSKQYILPSGKSIRVQGYENDFLDYIFKNNLLREDEVCFTAPRIKYDTNRHYYPDFFIPKYNLIVEIKSNYTFKQRNILKEQAAKLLYNYIIIVDKQYDEFAKLISTLSPSSEDFTNMCKNSVREYVSGDTTTSFNSIEYNDQNYSSPSDNKARIPWNKNKTYKQLKGDDYIKPTAKPFKIIINDLTTMLFTCEQDFFLQTNLNTATIKKLKHLGEVTVKRQRNSKHNFNNGDIIKYIQQ